MPFPFPFATSFFRRWSDHAGSATVAAEFHLSRRTVQRLFARFAEQGAAAIEPDYHACGQHQPTGAPAAQIQRLCQTRRDHPAWGSEMIRLELADAAEPLPCARTIRRHLHQAGLQPAPAGRPPRAAAVPRATEPHQVWQVDASEELVLRTGQRVCWLRVVDECSGAFLRTLVFPQARWEQVARQDIQQALRLVLRRWGLPGRLRVDNGYPWGSSGDFPPEMALWLFGLGIDMVWIDPGCPQQNGVVERAQQTGQDWAEPHTCAAAAELQQRCHRLDQRQRERYPYRAGLSRLEVYPELAHSGRPYTSPEVAWWEPARAWHAVAACVGRRQVDKTGSVSLYNRGRYVGKQHIGTEVYVRLDPTGPTWVIADRAGQELRTHAATELTAERMRTLQVANRKGKRRR